MKIWHLQHDISAGTHLLLQNQALLPPIWKRFATQGHSECSFQAMDKGKESPTCEVAWTLRHGLLCFTCERNHKTTGTAHQNSEPHALQCFQIHFIQTPRKSMHATRLTTGKGYMCCPLFPKIIITQSCSSHTLQCPLPLLLLHRLPIVNA